MLFNGKDPRSIDPSISVSREIPPGLANRKIRTLATAGGEILTGVEMERGHYTVVLNIAARSLKNALEMRERIAEWAASSGNTTARLKPSHTLDRYYDAIVESISEPEFGRGFFTVDVVFFLPRPVSVDINNTVLNARGGHVPVIVSANVPIRPIITHTLEQSANVFEIKLDGEIMLRMTGEFSTGQVIEMDTDRELLTLDGKNAMMMLDPQVTRWKPGFKTGTNNLRISDKGHTRVEWRKEWQ